MMGHVTDLYRDPETSQWGWDCTCGSIHGPALTLAEASRLALEHERSQP